MRIEFFEEYPSAEQLAPADRLAFPSTVYLAAPDLDAFRAAARTLARINPDLEAAWWPLLRRSYWVSPFASADELEALAASLEGASPLRVLLDLELPLIRPARFLRGLPGFRRRRRTVQGLFERLTAAGHRVATAEYPLYGLPLGSAFMRSAGIAYPGAPPHLRLPMYYSSMIPTRGLRRRVRRGIEVLARRHPGEVGVGLGTIAQGVLRHERMLSAAGLDRDLAWAANAGVANATIFRLGGLDDDTLEVVRRHAG
jgi:hypothetical protein